MRTDKVPLEDEINEVNRLRKKMVSSGIIVIFNKSLNKYSCR